MWRFHSIPLKWFRLLRNSVFEAYIAAILFRNYEKMEKSVTRRHIAEIYITSDALCQYVDHQSHIGPHF